jgi:hypothetical protein
VAYRNLDEFLTRLEQVSDVARFTIGQSELGMPEIAPQDVSKVHLFTDSNGTRIVRNLFGTSERVGQALRVASLGLIAERLEQLLEIGKPGALGAMISRAMTMFSAIRTTTNRRAPNELQVLSFSDWRNGLGAALKIVQSHSIQATLLTAGETPRMTSASLHFDENEIVGEFWPDLAVGETVALVIGGDPAYMIAAYAPLPDLIHRSYFASWLRDKPLDMMRLPGLDVEIPSNAECVIAATVTEQTGEVTLLDVTSVWTKPHAIYCQILPCERELVRNAYVEIMLPLVRLFLPGVHDIRLSGEFGVLTVNPSRADTKVILRQLWAIPISVSISYWLILPETDDIRGTIEGLVLHDIKSLSKLIQNGNMLGVLLDASSTRETRQSSELDQEREQIFWHFKRGWRSGQPTGES